MFNEAVESQLLRQKKSYNSKSNMYSLARYIRRNMRAANAKVKMTISTADPP